MTHQHRRLTALYRDRGALLFSVLRRHFPERRSAWRLMLVVLRVCGPVHGELTEGSRDEAAPEADRSSSGTELPAAADPRLCDA